MSNFFNQHKKYIYQWFTLIFMLSPIPLIYSQVTPGPIPVDSLKPAIDQAIIQAAQAAKAAMPTQTAEPEITPYALDAADKELIEKLQAQTNQATSVSLTLPTLGAIALRSPGHDQPYVGNFAEEDINLSPLPVLITSGTVTLDTSEKVTITGDATVFGKPAQMSLVELRKKSEAANAEDTNLEFSGVTLRMTFKEKPTITLFPGKTLELSTINLVLDEEQTPELATDITIFNQKTTLAFGANPSRLTLRFTLDTIRLGSLTALPGTTPLTDVTLKQATVSTERLLTITPTAKPETPTTGTDTGDVTTTITGTINLFDRDITAAVHFITDAKEGTQGIVLNADLPTGWQFPGTSVHFQKTRVIGSSIDYYDHATEQTYPKGLSILADFELPDVVAALMHRCTADQSADKLACQNKTVTLMASFDPADLSKIRFGTKLADTIFESEKVAIGPVLFAFEAKMPPAFILDITLTIKPSEKDRTIVFRAETHIAPDELSFSASLRPDDLWQNPFGIKGFAIGGLGTKMGINYAQFAATGLPSEVGLAGSLKLGDKTLSLATVFDTHFKEMALRGQLQGELSLVDIVQLFAQPMGVQIPVDKIPRIAIKDVLVKFAPQTVTIGQITIEQGLTLQGALALFTLAALLDFNVDATGIRAKGYTNAVNIKDVLFIRGDSPQGGPILDVQLNAAQQYVHLNGSLELKDITKTNTTLDITSNGIRFNFNSKFGDAVYAGKPLLYAEVIGTAGTLVNPQFMLAITFEQTLNRFILDQLNQGIAQAKQQVEQATAKAQQNLSPLTTAAQQVQQKADSITSQINQAKQAVATIQTRIDSVSQSLATKQQEVQTLQHDVDELNTKINNEKNRFNSLSTIQKAIQSVPTGARLAGWGSELAAKEVAYRTAKAALDAAEEVSVGVLRTAQQAAQGALTEAQNFLNLFLSKAIPSSLNAVKSAASDILTIAQKGELGVLSAGQQAGSFVLSAFDVRRIYFNSNLDSIKAGVLANVQADLVLVKQPVTVNFNLDVHNVTASIAPIIKEGQTRFNQALAATNFATKLNLLNQTPQVLTQANQALQIPVPTSIATNLTTASQKLQQTTDTTTQAAQTTAPISQSQVIAASTKGTAPVAPTTSQPNQSAQSALIASLTGGLRR